MAEPVTRRGFLGRLGVGVGAAAGAAAGGLAGFPVAQAVAQPKGNVPDKAFKIGHMTFFTSGQVIATASAQVAPSADWMFVIRKM